MNRQTDWRAARGSLALLLTLLSAYLVAMWFLPGKSLAVFSGDAGVKYLQIQALADGHSWLDHPAPELDPQQRLFPIPPPYVLKEGARHVSIYLNPFVFLAQPLYSAGGPRGVRGAVALCAVGLVLLCLPLATRLGLSPRMAVLAAAATLAGTPAWFYGAVFWEHAPGALLSVAGTVLLLDTPAQASTRRVLMAGVLLGAAASCRPEAMLYLASVTLAFALVARKSWLPATLAVAGLATYIGSSLLLPGLPLNQMIGSIVERIEDASFLAVDERSGFPGGRLGLARVLLGQQVGSKSHFDARPLHRFQPAIGEIDETCELVEAHLSDAHAFAVVSDRAHDGEGGHDVGPQLLDLCCRALRDEGAVLDGANSESRRAQDGLVGVAVGRHVGSLALALVDDRSHLGVGILASVDRVGRAHDASRAHDLDVMSALAELFAYRFQARVDAVGDDRELVVLGPAQAQMPGRLAGPTKIAGASGL